MLELDDYCDKFVQRQIMGKITIEEFKTRCLATLEKVRITREPMLITKRGHPIAKLIPVDESADFLGRMEGIVQVHGDIESPIEPPEAWEVLR